MSSITASARWTVSPGTDSLLPCWAHCSGLTICGRLTTGIIKQQTILMLFYSFSADKDSKLFLSNFTYNILKPCVIACARLLRRGHHTTTSWLPVISFVFLRSDFFNMIYFISFQPRINRIVKFDKKKGAKEDGIRMIMVFSCSVPVIWTQRATQAFHQSNVQTKRQKESLILYCQGQFRPLFL